jgi:PhzF family phenazine biosynthesis protein
VTRLAWVDVFAAGPMSGSPLAVVLDAGDPSASRVQALARELGGRAVALVLPPEAEGDRRLRVFTTGTELPLAGHALVGAAWVLHAAGRTPERATLETAAGTLAVRVRGTVATAELPPPVPGPEVDAAEIGRALGVHPAARPPPRVWSAGLPQLMVAVDGEQDVAEAVPDHAVLRALGERDGWTGVSVYAIAGGEGARLRVGARHFAPLLGVPEDPVTGGAAGALGAHLAAAGLCDAEGRLELVVAQADATGRGGEVAVRAETAAGAPRRVQIGGRVVLLMEGRLTGL